MQRSRFSLKTMLPIMAILLLSTISNKAFSQVSSENIYETVLDRYQAVASIWQQS